MPTAATRKSPARRVGQQGEARRMLRIAAFWSIPR